MDKTAIYRKTEKGLAEQAQNLRTLDRRLRPLLILVDGNRSALQIHALIDGIGLRDDDFDELERGGYIEAIDRPGGNSVLPPPPTLHDEIEAPTRPVTLAPITGMLDAPTQTGHERPRDPPRQIGADTRPQAPPPPLPPPPPPPPPPARPPAARGTVERYADGKRYLCETATDKLGLKSFLFVMKVERCGTIADLLALLPEFEQALAKRFDATYARHCRRIARTILGD